MIRKDLIKIVLGRDVSCVVSRSCSIDEYKLQAGAIYYGRQCGSGPSDVAAPDDPSTSLRSTERQFAVEVAARIGAVIKAEISYRKC